jgi:serine/threonine protein kinase
MASESLPGQKTSVCPECGSPSLAEDRTPFQADELPPPPKADFPSSTISPVERVGAAEGAELPIIGGYEILSELGRGGMGIVYRARQLSLGRVVALKMMLGGEYGGPELRLRFRKEAEAVARLQHPNIVQIHEVGEESGRPFFALEYVDGKSLAQHLAGAPLAPRPAALLLRTLAQAMQYAHERAVVHRDLKPGNVLLTADGVPKITDFGLARLLGEDGGQTRTGSVMGTPSYMAPEQTRGEVHHLGPRTDVYALGAVLYECLTGWPPFRAASPLETARQVLEEEPVAPARLQPGLPRDLETICLKCLQKKLSHRYATAGALADDLGRFLDGKPVHARPVNVWEKWWKWIRRRPAAAALIGVSMAAAIILIAGGLLYNARLHRERDKAQDNFRLALDAVNRSYTQISEDVLLNAPHMEPLRRRLLQSARDFYERFISERGDDPTLQAELGRAYWRLGNITRQTGSKIESTSLFERAVQIQQRLAEHMPDVAEHQFDLAMSRVNLGGVLAEQGQLKRAEEEYGIALSNWRELVRDHADREDYRSKLAHALNALGGVRRAGSHHDGAIAVHQEALAILKELADRHPDKMHYRRLLAESYTGLGDVASVAGDWKDAQQNYAAAHEALESLVREYPDNPVFLGARADACRNLSRVAHQAQDYSGAVEYGEKCLADYEKLARAHPAVVGYQTDFAMAWYQLGEVHLRGGDLNKAQAAYKQAIPIRESLVRLQPEVPDHRERLANVHISLSEVYQRQGKTAESRACTWESLRISEELAKEYPARLDYQMALGLLYFNCAAMAAGEDEERLAWYDKAVATLAPALERRPKHHQTRQVLCAAHAGRGHVRGRLGRRDAMPDWDRALELDDEQWGPSLRAKRAITLAHLGDRNQAMAEVDELSAPGVLRGGGLFDLACACAVAAATVARDTDLRSEDRRERARLYEDRAIDLLTRSAAAGYFGDAAQLNNAKTSPDLAPLRERDEYQKLVREWEGKLKAKQR